MNMEPATLEHSTGRLVSGWADRESYNAGDMYVPVLFDTTSAPANVYRSKVLAFTGSNGGL